LPGIESEDYTAAMKALRKIEDAVREIRENEQG